MGLAISSRAIVGVVLAAFALSSAGGGWSQTAPPPRAAIPQFPPGPDFVGVAGSAAETARIAALCGPNRNAADGYVTKPAFPGQTKAPIVSGTQGYAVEHIADIDRPFGMDFLPNGEMLVSFRNGGMRIVTRAGVVSEPLTNVPQVISASAGIGDVRCARRPRLRP